MINLNELKKEFKELNIELLIIPFVGKSQLFSLWELMVVVTQDWIDYLDIDNNAFHILVKLGQCCFYKFLDDEDVRHERALSFAIDCAEKYSLKITVAKKKEILDGYGFKEEDFDFSNICDQDSILSLVNKYGLPLKLTFPRYFGDFYYVAEKNNKSRHMIEGTQYRNGKVYRSKSYSYGELCSRYDSDEVSVPKKKKNKDVEYNNSIKKRIIEHDAFDDVEANNDDLLNHQKAGLLLASRYDKFAFFYDTGTGKTVMTLSIIKKKQEEEDAHFLILAPKAIIKTAWLNDSKDFFPELRIFPLSNNFYYEEYQPLYERWKKYTAIPRNKSISKNSWKIASEVIDFESDDWIEKWNKQMAMRQQIRKRMIELADHYIVNIEKFRYDPDQIMDNYIVNGLVVDESAILKNPKSKSAQVLFSNADSFDYIYLLSGKPAPNNSTEYYAQMKLVDPNTFWMSYNRFKSTYFSGSGSKIAPLSPKAEDDVANMIAVRSLIVSKKDCLSLPDMCQVIRHFKLPDRIMKQYDNLYKYCIFALQDNAKNKRGVYYSSVCRLAIFTKLREIASGFMVDEYGTVAELHKLKLLELTKIVDEHPEEQIIIWCQFEHEIKQVEKTLSKYGRVVTAYGKTRDIDRSIDMFKSGEARYIVAHPKSIKYGVTFVKCNIAIYYSMSYSAEDFYQSRDRIHRMGQTRVCTYYFIQAENTIDEIMYEAVEQKMSYAEIFAVIVKQAAKHGINYQNFLNADEAPIKDELISTQLVKDKYDFEIMEDNVFVYKNSKDQLEGVLYNTLLSDTDSLRPEEVLFEIGYLNKTREIDEKNEDENKNAVVTYHDIIDVAKWVVSEMKELKIKRIQKVYDYLEEQIQKQYEIDVANGGETITNIEELSIKRSRKKPENTNFKFVRDGQAKKVSRTLMEIRKEIDEIFFDSGKYRLTHKCFCGDNSVAHCHLDLGLIYQSKKDYTKLTPETLFDLLHEIGHLESNTAGMTRQEMEYFATKWALERMKLYDFKLSEKRQKEFDDYINGYSSRKNKILKGRNATELDWEE